MVVAESDTPGHALDRLPTAGSAPGHAADAGQHGDEVHGDRADSGSAISEVHVRAQWRSQVAVVSQRGSHEVNSRTTAGDSPALPPAPAGREGPAGPAPRAHCLRPLPGPTARTHCQDPLPGPTYRGTTGLQADEQPHVPPHDRPPGGPAGPRTAARPASGRTCRPTYRRSTGLQADEQPHVPPQDLGTGEFRDHIWSRNSPVPTIDTPAPPHTPHPLTPRTPSHPAPPHTPAPPSRHPGLRPVSSVARSHAAPEGPNADTAAMEVQPNHPRTPSNPCSRPTQVLTSPSVSVSVGWGGASSFVDKRKGLSFRESVVKLVPEEKAFSGEHDSGWTVPAEQREAT